MPNSDFIYCIIYLLLYHFNGRPINLEAVVLGKMGLQGVFVCLCCLWIVALLRNAGMVENPCWA